MKSADWRPRGCDESQESADGSSMVTRQGFLEADGLFGWRGEQW